MAHNGGRLQVGLPGDFVGPQYSGPFMVNAAAGCNWGLTAISSTGVQASSTAISTITRGNPTTTVITTAPHGFAVGERVTLDVYGKGWWTPNPDVSAYILGVPDATSFTIGANTEHFPVFPGGGSVRRASLGPKWNHINQTNGAFKEPPKRGGVTVWEWWTSQLRMYSPDATEAAERRQWVLTWEGNCNPLLTIEDGSSNLYETLHLISSGPGNRRIYEIRKAMNPTGSEGPPNNAWNTWTGKTGENGFSILCRIRLTNQVGEVNNVRLYRLDHEVQMLSGETWTPEAISMFQGSAGMLRWMDSLGGGSVPGTCDWAGVYPATWSVQYGFDGHAGIAAASHMATTISENYWLVTPRADKAVVEDRMALAFHCDTMIIQHQFTMTKGTVTTLTKTNHGFTNGELIQRIQNYYHDKSTSGPGPITYGIHESKSHYSGPGGDPSLFMAWPVTVINADTLTIPLDTSAETWNGNTACWMRPARIKYGPTGTTHYMHDGSGGWERSDGTDDTLIDNTVREGVFMVPIGKTVASAHFVTGMNRARGMHPKFIVELCNKIGAHAYVTVADWASQSYLSTFLGYLRDNLAPGLETWVELGNEPWQGPGFFYASARQNGWLYWASNWASLAPVWSSYQLPDEKSRNIHGHLHRVMSKYVKGTVFAGSGKTVRTCMGLQVGGGSYADGDVFARGIGNYPAGDKPGNYPNTDYFAYAPYDCNIWPGESTWEVSPPPAPWLKQCLDWYYAGQKDTAFNYMRDIRISRDGSMLNKFKPGGHFKQLSDNYGAGFTHYEGGFGHHRDVWYLSNDRAACEAAGYTVANASKLYWDFYRSTQHAQVMTYVFNRWFDVGCVFPSWFTFCSPHSDIRSSPGWSGFNWGLWPVNSAYYSQRIIPSITTWRELNTGVITATLIGRGFLTATAKSSKGASATLAGTSSATATGSVSAQVFYGLSDFAENAALNFLLRASGSPAATVYLALHKGTTGENGTTNELTATGYLRQAITFDAPSNGQTVSAAQVTFGPFSTLPGTVTHFSIWTAASGGNCLATGAFTTSATPQVGASLNVPAGGITITAN